MLREPRPGRSKTRLGRDIGLPEAARWQRRQALSLLRRLRADGRWQVSLAVSPDREGMESRIWPSARREPPRHSRTQALIRRPQGPGDLGARMARCLRAAGPRPALLIGADIPGVTPAVIARAFAALGRAEIVFGPAEDGGFWLVGARCAARFPLRAFEGARWSSPHALADCLAALARLGRPAPAFADRLRDVDRAADLPAPEAARR